MKPFALVLTIGLAVVASVASAVEAEEGWESLFDGETYGKWKANENTDSWQIKDGCFVCQGPRHSGSRFIRAAQTWLRCTGPQWKTVVRPLFSKCSRAPVRSPAASLRIPMWW